MLIPHAKDRPATRKRWVHGVGTAEKPGQVFFQKNLDDGTPSWVKRRSIQHSDHVNDYPLVNDLATLVWLAQIAALEIHVPQWRFGRNGARKNPDRLVLDLDPGEGAGLPECVEVAKIVRDGAAAAWDSTRCRSRAAARASTSTPPSTASSRATRCRRSRTSWPGCSRPTTPTSS